MSSSNKEIQEVVIDEQTLRGAADLMDPAAQHATADGHKRWMVAISGPESALAMQRVFQLAQPTDEIILAHVSQERPLPATQSFDSETMLEDMRVRQADLAASSGIMREALRQCQHHSKFCRPLALLNPAGSNTSLAATLAREAQRIGVDRVLAGGAANPIAELDLSQGKAKLSQFQPSRANQESRDFKHATEDIVASAYHPEGEQSN